MPDCPACGHVWEPATKPLTERQRDVRDFILLTMATKRRAPTHREIAGHFNFRSLVTVREHLANLERKGFLNRDYNHPRAITAVAS